ncbi:TIR domain-containing protein [Hwangdonia sp.]|uniref:TIR domain-containing protein n=1 Tax=Hwangdonia sp. TaxID=1883432 RepID=UPI003AB159CC
MGYRNKTYVIFDGDNDMWAYARMKGWNALDNIDFNFFNAHDLKPLTGQAANETYIKQRLLERIKSAKQVVVLVGSSTKNLFRYVRWEIEQCQNLDLPIVVVNLNKVRSIDNTLCPPILKGANAMHVSFRMKIIKYALDYWPNQYDSSVDKTKRNDWHYPASVYKDLGLDY